jgi:hypothetical protein
MKIIELHGFNLERIYWCFVLACLFGYGFDQGISKLNSHGYYEWQYQEHHYFLWMILLLVLFLVSSGIVLVRLWSKYFGVEKTGKPVLLHVLFVSFLLLPMIFRHEANLSIKYLQSIYYARDNAPCQERAKKTNTLSICYRVLNDLNESAIVIDPNHETTAETLYLENVPSVAKSLQGQDATSLGCCWFSSKRLHDDVYLISTWYQ